MAKALLLVVAGFGVLELLRPGIASEVRRYVEDLPLAEARRFLETLIARVTASRHRVALASAALFAYAGLFTAEGLGLWMEKRWAELLTVIATISFIPFEVYEVAHKVTAVRVVLIVVNVAIVIYLIYRLRHHR